MHTIDRRTFLATSATALGTAAFLRPSLRAAATTAEGFRIFACDWTLDKRCDPAAYELAARIGLDGVQVDFGWPPDGGGRPPLFAEAKQDELLNSVKDQMKAQAFIAKTSTIAELADYLKSQNATWKKALEQSGVEPN